MDQDQTIELIVHVLHAIDRTAKSGEIAEYAKSPSFSTHAMGHSFDVASFADSHTFAGHITRCIKRHQESKTSAKWAVAGNRSVGWKTGPAALQTLRLTHRDLRRPADTQFTGLAGEYAVMSELLASDWNVAKLPHDDGVDVLATRGQKLRTVQVKTAHSSPGNKFTFSVMRRAHDQHESIHHYYVLVMRSIEGVRYLNDFLILNNHDIRELQVIGAVSTEGEKSWKILVHAEHGKVFIGERDCTHKLNRFRELFI